VAVFCVLFCVKTGVGEGGGVQKVIGFGIGNWNGIRIGEWNRMC